MDFIREITGTGIRASALGLGTVKIGRNEGVKYPAGFTIPDDSEVRNLLSLARDLGINLIDTAPAYGNSEERLGQLMTNRNDWIIATKTGEEFMNGKSFFDFSPAHTRRSIERSLRRLRTDYLDIVLIHSDGRDEEILRESGCLETLRACRDEGKIRAIGISTKTDAGGRLAAELTDIVMLTYNLQQQDQAALDQAAALGKGVLVKKGLMSGHIGQDGKSGLKDSMRLIFGQPAINSVIVGTINPTHLRENVGLAREILGQ